MTAPFLICVGNAIVDILVKVEDSFLKSNNLIKGSMSLVKHEEFDNIFSKISEYNIVGLNIFISQSGDLNVSIKFENPDALKSFESNYLNIIADLKGSLVFKENNFVGVCTFTYEKEAASTKM